jgi:hypothetical protein
MRKVGKGGPEAFIDASRRSAVPMSGTPAPHGFQSALLSTIFAAFVEGGCLIRLPASPTATGRVLVSLRQTSNYS